MVDEEIDTSQGGIPLADGWLRFSSKVVPGKYYYFNKTTGESSWSSPFKNQTRVNEAGVFERKQTLKRKGILSPRSRSALRDSMNASVSAKSLSAAIALTELQTPRVEVAAKILDSGHHQQKVQPGPSSTTNFFAKKRNLSLPVHLENKEAAVKRKKFDNGLDICRMSVLSRVESPSIKKQEMEHCKMDAQDEMVCEPIESELLTSGTFDEELNHAQVPAHDSVFLVIGTNVFMHDIALFKDIAQTKSEFKVIIPWTVIKELDGLKTNKNIKKQALKAQAAIDYLHKSIPANTDHIKVQNLREFSKHLIKCDNADDEIMNCALQHTEKGLKVILITNDSNLRVKAAAHGIQSMVVDELKIIMKTARSVGVKQHKPRDKFEEMYKKWCICLKALLSNLLENEMKAKYKGIWHKIVFKPPPWTLKDCLNSIDKQWNSFFSDILHRKENSVHELLHVLNDIEATNASNPALMESFRRIAIDLVTACQIIPEYNALASQVMAELQQGHENDIMNDDVLVVFENIWNILSSYGANLANIYGIAHDLEDKLYQSFTMESIKEMFLVRFTEVQVITFTLKRYMSSEDQLTRELQVNVMLKTVRAITAEGQSVRSATWDQFYTFFQYRRDLLERAFQKFFFLLEMLSVCQARMLEIF